MYNLYNMLYMTEVKKECPVQLLGTVTIGPKGQVVIPAEARHLMNVAPGDKLVALYINKKQSVAFVPENELQALIDKMSHRFDTLKDILTNK